MLCLVLLFLQGTSKQNPCSVPELIPPRSAGHRRVPATLACPLTAVQFLWGDGGHRPALDAAGVLAGGRCLRAPRPGVGFQQVRQPQDLTVAVKRVRVQAPVRSSQ